MDLSRNEYINEATINNDTVTITFPQPVGKLMLTNDSGLNDLSVKLYSGATARTLKPTEVLELSGYKLETIILTSTGNVPYRLWALY